MRGGSARLWGWGWMMSGKEGESGTSFHPPLRTVMQVRTQRSISRATIWNQACVSFAELQCRKPDTDQSTCFIRAEYKQTSMAKRSVGMVSASQDEQFGLALALRSNCI
jgi:hypothetical protein